MPETFAKTLAASCACLALWGCGGGQEEVSTELETLQGRRVTNNNSAALAAARQQILLASQSTTAPAAAVVTTPSVTSTPAPSPTVVAPPPPAPAMPVASVTSPTLAVPVPASPKPPSASPTPVAAVVAPAANPSPNAAASPVVPASAQPVVQTPVVAANLPQSGATSSCGPDVGGWTTPVPSKVDSKFALRDLKQPGSRIFYISSAAGSDTTGVVYFWNGTSIIDESGKSSNAAGVAYGTDPANPSAAVKPFKRWAYVGPRSNGGDIGSKGTVGSARPTTRSGSPDWWLFKRGDTFDLEQDLLSFERESNASATFVNSSLAVPGGRSALERQVVGAWGDICKPRPRFVHPMLGFLTRIDAVPSPSFKNVAYLSLHFDGTSRNAAGAHFGLNLAGMPADSTSILFEDLWIQGVPSQIQGTSSQITIRRSLITDVYKPDGSHVQGLYVYGKRDSVLRIEDSVLLRNGFKLNPQTVAWPPSGDQTWNIYNRNLYLSGEMRNMDSVISNTVSMMGASGDQMRSGMRLEGNYFYQGYVHMGAHGGYPSGDGPTGLIKDNVLQRFVATTKDVRAHPGGGFILGSGAQGVAVTGNIVTNVQHVAPYFALELNAIDWECSGMVFKHATRANLVSNNVFDSSNSPGAIRVRDGLPTPTSAACAVAFTFPGVTGNEANQNVLINAGAKTNNYVTQGAGAAGTTNDTVYRNNRMFATRAEAAAALGWPDADRSLKTYLKSKGVSVSSDDGFPEYYQRAITLRRGSWNPAWAAKSLTGHVREGMGMTPLN